MIPVPRDFCVPYSDQQKAEVQIWDCLHSSPFLPRSHRFTLAKMFFSGFQLQDLEDCGLQ